MPIRVCLFVCALFAFMGCKSDVKIMGEFVHQFTETQLFKAQFSSGGKYLAAIDMDENVYVWDINTKKRYFQVPEKKLIKPIRHLTMSFNANLLLLASDNMVSIWDLEQQILKANVNFNGKIDIAKISSLEISNNEDKLLVGMSDGSINMADINTRVNNQIFPHSRPVTHLRFGPHGNFFLSASEDGLVGLREFGTPKAQFTEQFPHRITSLVTNDDFNAYFVSDGLNSQFIKGLQKNNIVSQLDYMDRFKMFRKSKFILNEQYLVTSSSKSQLSFWDQLTGRELGTFKVKSIRKGATTIDMLSHQDNLFTITSDGILQKWNIKDLFQL